MLSVLTLSVAKGQSYPSYNRGNNYSQYNHNNYSQYDQNNQSDKNPTFSFVIGGGFNSYNVNSGRLLLLFPYTITNSSDGTNSTYKFSSSTNFAQRKILPDLVAGFDVAGNRLYSDCHFSVGLGNYSSMGLDIGGGFVFPFKNNDYSIRVGASYFGAFGSANLGSIGNYGRDITIDGETYYHDYYYHGKSGTTYYDATKIDVSMHGITTGFRPNVSFVYQAPNQRVFYKFNVGYNIPVYQSVNIQLNQKGVVDQSSVNNNYGTSSDKSEPNNGFYTYRFNNESTIGPFLCKGLMANVSIGFKIGKL